MREDELLRHVYARNAQLQSRATGGADVLIPPGDDMALVQLQQRNVLIATDQVVEGRHFVRGTSMRAIGRKAVLRNVSDIAAMAAVPSACVAAVALPKGTDDAQVLELLAGLQGASEEHGCPLVGGDTSVHAAGDSPLVVTVTVLAEPGPSGRVIQRAGARAGDLLCVTGALGGTLQADGSGKHLEFVPRVREALELMSALGDSLHAMIDISDGLGRDAAHLARAAGLDVEIRAESVPCNSAVTWRRALSDGEDYELAFACAGQPPAKLGDVPVTVVGTFVASRTPTGGACRVVEQGTWHDASTLGWQHGDAQ